MDLYQMLHRTYTSKLFGVLSDGPTNKNNTILPDKIQKKLIKMKVN